MEVAVSLAAEELYSDPGWVNGCWMVQHIWRRKSGVGFQFQEEAGVLKAGFGSCPRSGCSSPDHTASESQGASESSEGKKIYFLVNLQCHFEDQFDESSSETCTP